MKKNFKRGIAMIELIFALVIIGITLLSAPMLIQQSIASSNVTLQQESIAAIASHTGILLTSHWDEADANYSNGTAPILAVTRNLPVTDPFIFTTTIPRVGMKNIIGRTTVIGNSLVYTSNTLGTDFNDSTFLDDIDDYHGSNIGLSIYNNENTTVQSGDYIDTKFNLNTQITYANDFPIGNLAITTTANNIFAQQNITGQSNIKFINTRLTTANSASELAKDIRLTAFSCNIGTYLPQGKDEL